MHQSATRRIVRIGRVKVERPIVVTKIKRANPAHVAPTVNAFQAAEKARPLEVKIAAGKLRASTEGICLIERANGIRVGVCCRQRQSAQSELPNSRRGSSCTPKPLLGFDNLCPPEWPRHRQIDVTL